MSEYITRFPPCPAYETRRFECWLEDMAKDGWLLSLDFFSRYGFATFRLVMPQTLRFRLQPAPRKAGRLSRRDAQQAAVDLAEEYGWHYLGRYDGFFIYYTADPELPELHTDPQVLALALEEHLQHRRNAFIFELFIVLLFLGLLLWVGPIRFTLSRPVWYLPLLLFTILFSILLRKRERNYLLRLQQELQMGNLPENRTYKQSRMTLHRIIAMAAAAIWVLLVLVSPYLNPHFHWQPLSEYEEPLPFATAEDLTGGTFSTGTWSEKHNNEVGVRSTLLAASHIQMEQYGVISRDDEEELEVTITVEYFDMRSEWLAKQLYRDYLQFATQNSGGINKYKALEVPQLPVEQAAAYTNYHPYLLLRQGTRILRIRLLEAGPKASAQLLDWAPAFAESILD